MFCFRLCGCLRRPARVTKPMPVQGPTLVPTSREIIGKGDGRNEAKKMRNETVSNLAAEGKGNVDFKRNSGSEAKVVVKTASKTKRASMKNAKTSPGLQVPMIPTAKKPLHLPGQAKRVELSAKKAKGMEPISAGMVKRGTALQCTPKLSGIKSLTSTKTTSFVNTANPRRLQAPAKKPPQLELLCKTMKVKLPAKGGDMQPKACKICARKFTAERLQQHELICRRVREKTRLIFSSARQRIVTEARNIPAQKHTHRNVLEPVRSTPKAAAKKAGAAKSLTELKRHQLTVREIKRPYKELSGGWNEPTFIKKNLCMIGGSEGLTHVGQRHLVCDDKAVGSKGEAKEGRANATQQGTCRYCLRKFNIDRLEKHRLVCMKLKQKTRSKFNSANQRLHGTSAGK